MKRFIFVLVLFLSLIFSPVYAWFNSPPSGGGTGSGDMSKTTYDSDNNGVVDNASALEGHSASYFQVAGSYLTSSNIASSISDSDTTHCPDGNSVYDALALKQDYSAVLAALAGIAITVDGNNVTFPGGVITTAANGSRIVGTLDNTTDLTFLTADTYGWYFYNGVPYFNINGTGYKAQTVKTEKLAVFSIPGDTADNEIMDSYIPAASTVTGWVIETSDTSNCSAVIDIEYDTYSTFTFGSSIAGSEIPTLSNAKQNKDTSLTTWTTSLAADSFLRAKVTSLTCNKSVIVTILGTR